MGRALRAPFLSAHPTDEELLAFLDGELDGRALTRIRSHLDACWPCRGRRDRFNQAISAFVDARMDECAGHEGFPPSAALRLSARLDEVDARAAATRPSFWRRMFWQARVLLTWRPAPAVVAQACVAMLTITLVVISIGRGPSVSAQELLARTVAAQEARLRPVPQPVLYQRLQVSRRAVRGASVAGGAMRPRETQQTWEIWSDTVHGRYRERVGAFANIARRAAPDAEACGEPAASASLPKTSSTQMLAPARLPMATAMPASAPAPMPMAAQMATAPTVIRELESILCANGLRSAQPLSARAWSEWRGRVSGASERVRENRASDDEPAALVLHTRLPGGDQAMRIREAELVVRADDWHPLAQRFTVEIDRELVTFELRELSFEVVELASVAPAFFDDRPEPTEAPATAVATAAVEAVSEADVIAAEVQAWDALHKLGALRGEPVEIVRAQTSPRVEVRGLVASPERKQAIVDAVSAIPLVTASIRTVDEALAEKPTHTASAAPAVDTSTSTMVQTGTVPILPLLEAYLHAPGPPVPAASGANRDNSIAGSAGAGRVNTGGVAPVAPVGPAGPFGPAGPTVPTGTVVGASGAGTRAGVGIDRPATDANAATGTSRASVGLVNTGAGSVQAIATDVVSLSRDAMTDAWALERLARFAQGLGGDGSVRPSSRRTLERMAAELASATAAKLDALQQRVTPIAAPVLDDNSSAVSATSGRSASSAPQPPESRDAAGASHDDAADANDSNDWPRLALRVFARAREADELTRRLFTESDAGLVELGPSVRQLIAACTAGRQGALTLSERLATQHQQHQ